MINFIVDFPSSNRFINIIVVVNRLIKMRYIVPINLINTILVAEYFIKYVFKLHKLPNLIIWSLKSDSAPVRGEAYEPTGLRT